MLNYIFILAVVVLWNMELDADLVDEVVVGIDQRKEYVFKRLHHIDKKPDGADEMVHAVTKLTFLLSSNISSVSHSLCSFFDNSYSSSLNLRCKVMFEITAHIDRVLWVNQMYNQLIEAVGSDEGNEPLIDATLLAISESLSTIDVKSEHPVSDFSFSSNINVCVFGNFSPKISLIYLISGSINLLVIDDFASQSQGNTIARNLKRFYQSKRVVLILSENDFALFRGLEMCDVIHIRDNISSRMYQYISGNLQHMVKSEALVTYESQELVIDESNKESQLTDLLKLSNSQTQIADLSKYVDWYASCLTPYNASLNFHIDFQGFKLLHGSKSDGAFNSTITLHFGVVKNNNQSDDSRCEVTAIITPTVKNVSYEIPDPAVLATIPVQSKTLIKRIHFVITYSNRMFQDNAYGLQDALLLVPPTFFSGYDNITLDITAEVVGIVPVVAISSKNNSTHHILSTATRNDDSNDVITVQVAFGCQLIQIYFKHYICYQTEQPWSYILQKKKLCVWAHISSSIMGNAIAVLAMSKKQQLLLYNTDYSVRNSYVVPFYTKTGRNTSTARSMVVAHDSLADIANVGDDIYFTIDVLFYGTCTKKRFELYQQLSAYAEAYNKTIKVICNVDLKTALFDEELEYHIKRSKVVVNNHSFDGSSLQTHRLIYLFSLGKCVINERSSVDPELDSEYEDAVIFSETNNNSDMIQKAHDVLMNESKWQECQTKSASKYTSISMDVIELSKAVYKTYEFISNS